MSVQTFSKKESGESNISTHFKVREFACKDGTDQILIDTDFVKNQLESIRIYFGKPITVTSGYRTPEYNKALEASGAAKNSYHIKGQAFDIKVDDIPPMAVSGLAYLFGIKGVINYSGFTHVDSRTSTYQYDTVLKKNIPETLVKKGSRGCLTAFIQYKCGTTIDGIFGSKTESALKEYQKAHDLQSDGIAGPLTCKNMVLSYKNVSH